MEFLIVALVIVVLAALVALVVMKQRSASLARRFGPEYDRAVTEQGSRRAGEGELRRLEHRRREIELQDLDPAVRTRYAEEWRAVQLRFVDEPEAAVEAADLLVVQVMADRGYPVASSDDRADMVVVDHPDLAADYRAAHEVSIRADAGEATLDELREGFQHYRALFDRLLDTDTSRDEAAPADVPGDEASPVEPVGSASADDGDRDLDDRDEATARPDDRDEATTHDPAYGEVGPEPRRTEARDAR